jgi:hypothetical protein
MVARSGRSKAHVWIPVSTEAKESFDFWLVHFSAWDGRCPIVQGFGPTAAEEVMGFVDASTRWGCGGTFWSKEDPDTLFAFRHEWTQAERERSIAKVREATGVLEMAAILIWLERFVSRCSAKRTCLATDSDTATAALERAFSPVVAMRTDIRAIRVLTASFHVDLRVRFVVGDRHNAIADALSKDDLELAGCLAAQRGLRLVCHRC